MHKYQKRPDLHTVYVPGIGRVDDDQILEGDFERFVPALLVRMPTTQERSAAAVQKQKK